MKCSRCGHTAENSTVKDYVYYCSECDEDKYKFEVEGA